MFVFDHGFLPIPGWSLSVVWLGEGGLPSKGILSLEFFSGGGANMQNCLVDRRLRAILCSLVLVPQRDLAAEFKINKQENFAAGLEKKVCDPNHPLLGNVVMGASRNAGAMGAAMTAMAQSYVALPLEAPVAAADDHSHAESHVTHSDANTHTVVVKPKLTAFSRPQAVASLTALSTQVNKMSQLYFDDKQKTIVMEYTFVDANAHLKTCNVEWKYTESDVLKVDPWRL